MARPQKTGLNYYNTDTDRYHDIKIKKLKFGCGAVGLAIYDYLLCEIYRDKGCFIEWNQDAIFNVAECLNVQDGLVKEIVRYCAEIGLFNSRIYSEQNILTSYSIQKRYSEICKNAKRKDWLIPELIKLTKEDTELKKEETKVNTSESTQSKVKESKVKESKELFNGNILLTFVEHQKLITEHGQINTDLAIKFLSDYKTEKGYKTKSDYLTLLRWVFDAVKKPGSTAKVSKVSKSFTDLENSRDKIKAIFK